MWKVTCCLYNFIGQSHQNFLEKCEKQYILLLLGSFILDVLKSNEMLIDSTLANDIEKKKLVSIASDIVRCLMVSVGVRMLTNQRPGCFPVTNKRPEGSESGWIYQEGSSIKHDTPEWHRLTNQRPGARLSDQSEGPTPRTFLAHEESWICSWLLHQPVMLREAC